MHRVKELRRAAGLSQAELAEYLNVQPAAVSKYETGRSELSEKHIAALCALFRVRAGYLLGLEETAENGEDGERLLESPVFGETADLMHRVDFAVEAADNTLLLLEHQHREITGLCGRYKRYVGDILYKLHQEGVPDPVISKASGINDDNLKLIVEEREGK